MNRLRQLALVTLLAASAWVAANATAHAKQNDNRGWTRHVIAGVITEVAPAGDSVVIDRRYADDDPDDDFTVQLTDETRTVPPDTSPEPGLRAVAVVTPDDDDNLLAVVLVLHPARDHHRPGPKLAPTDRACGTIAGLPDEGHMGTWTLDVEDLGALAVEVDADTRITPPHRTPEVGLRACVHYRQTDAGNVATHIQLRGEEDRRRVEIRGTIVGPLPADMAGEWVLNVKMRGHDDVTAVTVTPDTTIRGELADGVQVVVLAEVVQTDAGEQLVALMIQVVGADRGRGRDRGARSFHGEVTGVSDDGALWTIETADGSVEVAVTDRTRIVGLGNDENPVGMRVHVVAKPSDEGLVARLIRVER